MAELTQGAGTPVVTIVDRKLLRRAQLDCFLRPWADRLGLAVELAAPVAPTAMQAANSCKLAVVSLGGEPFDEAATQECVRVLRSAAPETPIVVLSDRDDPEDVVAAFQAGVSGFIPTSTEPAVALQIFTFIVNGGSFFPPRALLQVQQGPEASPHARNGKGGDPMKIRSNGLTTRQQEVLLLLGTGKPNKVIARELDMCEATVKVHVRQIMRKLGASNRTEAALICASQTSNEPRSGAVLDVVCGEGLIEYPVADPLPTQTIGRTTQHQSARTH